MLELLDIFKTYEGQPLLRGVSFEVGAAETVCLLGPSGSGKSTLLSIIAGLDQPDSGRVLWDGDDLVRVPAHLRLFGLMFQDYALFPHKTVARNVAFGLEMQNLPGVEIDRRVAIALAQVKLSAFADRRVTDLSGGEQQRVALARALAPGPRLLMFDEPLAALDRNLREELLGELRRLLRETDVPAIYVTHDQEEAFSIADRILLLHEGLIIQSGTPAEVSANPASGWVARFLGLGNVLEGTFLPGAVPRIRTAVGDLPLKCSGRLEDGEAVVGLLRPTVQAPSNDGHGGSVSGKVADVVFRNDSFRVGLDNGLYFYLKQPPVLGDPITLAVGPVECLEGSA